VAGVEGLEPPAIGFGDRCSTNWNYTPKSVRYILQLHFPCDVVFLEGSHQRHKGGRRIILMQASYTSTLHSLVTQCMKLLRLICELFIERFSFCSKYKPQRQAN
jgi:hypothetical protein